MRNNLYLYMNILCLNDFYKYIVILRVLYPDETIYALKLIRVVALCTEMNRTYYITFDTFFYSCRCSLYRNEPHILHHL